MRNEVYMKDTKEQVLEYLENNKGRFSSGETIAGELNLSRNSVWKAIESLRRSGYQIEAASRKGYLLSNDDDNLNIAAIARLLSGNINPDLIHIYNSIESTNKTAKGAAAFDAPFGTTIISATQTAGSGRKKRSFHSPNGGIYMSMVLSPDKIPFKNHALITAYAAISVCEAIKKYSGKKPYIKWMNDIFIDGKKVCGILTESTADMDTGELSWVVVGIGINFCVNTKSFPEGAKEIAGSIFEPGKAPVSKNVMIAEIINNILTGSVIGASFDTPGSTDNDFDHSEEILKKYRAYLNMLGTEITILSQDGEYKATALDIDDNAKLIVELPSGHKKTLRSEEISIRL